MNRGQWRLLVWYENFHEHEKKKDHIAPKLFFFFGFFFKQASGALGVQSLLQSLFSVVPMLPSRAGHGMCSEGHPDVLHPWVSSGGQVGWHSEGHRALGIASSPKHPATHLPSLAHLCFQQCPISNSCVAHAANK